MIESNSLAPQSAPRYRWVVLLVFALNGLLSQIYWLNFAAITNLTAQYYGVDPTAIYLLSLMFMVVYLVVGPFSSLLIDARGFRVGTSVGVVLTAGFGFLRVFATGPGDFWLLVIFQIGIAAGQPFLYNAISKMGARWFPPGERATAVGLANLGFFVGMLVAFAVPPLLIGQDGNPFILLLTLGILGLVIAGLFLAFGKDHPVIPFGDTTVIPMRQVLGDLKNLLKMRFAIVLAVTALIALGSFNAITTLLQNITGDPAVAADLPGTLAGYLGAGMILAGIVGLLILPALSDKLFKLGKNYARKAIMVLGFIAAAPISLAIGLVKDFTVLIVLTAVFGFFILPAFAVALQWIAEQTAPIPESESNNLLMYFGQIGGILFILLVPVLFNTGTIAIPNYSNAMYLFAVLGLITILLLISIKERKSRYT